MRESERERDAFSKKPTFLKRFPTIEGKISFSPPMHSTLHFFLPKSKFIQRKKKQLQMQYTNETNKPPSD